MTKTRHAIVVTHERLMHRGDVVQGAVGQLQEAGFDVQVIDRLDVPEFGQPCERVPEDTEIVVVLGGDGTILRAAELVHCTGVPIIGINMGHVGFLAEFESFQIHDAIRRIAERDYNIDERMIAHVDVWLPDAHEPLCDWALNDITIERADRGKMVELSIGVDGVEMSSFGCDGVIFSTPTGSTAYAFSAGGPIVWPELDAILVVPNNAHALFARPMVVAPTSRVAVETGVGSGPAVVVVDGRRLVDAPAGSRVEVVRGRRPVKWVRLDDSPFTDRLVTKFELPVTGWRGRSGVRPLT